MRRLSIAQISKLAEKKKVKSRFVNVTRKQAKTSEDLGGG
ncbi:MAG: hypothetical protein K0Q90_1713 [Paenibacillaceae bacterium]|nr:hypothetical protein [Paenibacillaceae bacterium]